MPLGDAVSFPALRTPVTVYGNLVSVSRGESVEEILGSGDATQSFQRFRLTKKPLTYLPAPGTATGRTGTLEIWISGVRWREVESLFLAGPEDEVYTVRQTVDGETEVTFGGLGYGKPLPSGASNVRAKYRHGAGRRARQRARSASSPGPSKASAAPSTRSRLSAAMMATLAPTFARRRRIPLCPWAGRSPCRTSRRSLAATAAF